MTSRNRMFGFAMFAMVAALLTACGDGNPSHQQPPRPDRTARLPTEPAGDAAAKALIARAKPLFAGLPASAKSTDNPVTVDKVALGRRLYFDKRLSLSGDISCNSCHSLSNYGVDVRPESGATSAGHQGAKGDRNSPTVYNAALHISQFWDGRASTVEEQAKGPILNPVEMAMPSEGAVLARLRKDAEYPALFAKAFPNDDKPMSYDNLGKAIGAFERKLITPAPFDAFLAGDTSALSAQQQRGLGRFMDAGCIACHTGPAVGGGMYQKLGLVKAYDTEDEGRAKVTGNPGEQHFFKVPSLRNIDRTGPYLHDGSVPTLEKMVAIMAEHQTPGGALPESDIADIVAFLKGLTGKLPAGYIADPFAGAAAEPEVTAVARTAETDKCDQEFAALFRNARIQFRTGSSQIQGAAKPLLRQLADVAKHCPMPLYIEGHTDNVGKAASNLTLSKERAGAVKSALQAMGVAGERLVPRGYGDTRPRADNDTDKGRAKNRRIEIKVVTAP